MNIKWIIRISCLSLLCLSGVIAQENDRVSIIIKNKNSNTDVSCSFDNQLETNLNSLQALESWFTLEQYQNVQEYRQRISQLEADNGAYGDALAPTLISLGLLQQESGEHREAKKAYERALHIIRINHGLYSTRQLPVLELLIESNIASDEWKAATDNHDHIYWLYKRNFRNIDTRFLPVIKRLRRWHIEAYNKDTGRSLSQHFRVADKTYEHGLNIIEKCTGNRQQALCFWHKACCEDNPGDNGQCPEKLTSR